MDRIFKIKQKAEIMNVLISESVSYLNKLKTFFQIPLVSISSLLIVLNSYFKEGTRELKIINMTLNGSNIILMGIFNTLKITEQLENLKSKSSEFIDLIHSIENDIYSQNINYETIDIYQKKLDLIIKYTNTDAIPSFIKNKIKKKYPNINFPLVMGGDISPNVSIDENNDIC